MKCYLINLDRSPERLKQMEAEFGRLGLLFTRVPAVDGKLLTQEELDAVTPPVRQWEIPIPPSEIGCFLSHKKCLEIVANGQDHYAAIFEDDIELSSDAAKLLSNLDWIPADADLVKLETFRTVVLLQGLEKIKGTDFKVARLLTKHLCAGGYIISKDAAKRMLLDMDVISIPVDNLMFDPACDFFSKFTVFQITPAMCRQNAMPSLIEADRKALRCEYIKRPSLPGLILREIKRSYGRSSHILSPAKLWTRLTSDKLWTRIQFKP